MRGLLDEPTASVILLLYGVCAAVYVLLAALILAQRRRGTTAWILAAASVATAFWAGAVALGGEPPLRGIAGGLDLLQSVAWYGFVLHLYQRGAPAGDRTSRLFLGLGLTAIAISVGALLIGQPANDGDASLTSAGIAVRLGLAVCKLLVIENIYRNARDEARWYVNLPCVALGGLFIYEIVLCADAALFRRVSLPMYEGRAIAAAVVAPLLAMAAARDRRWAMDIHVSRTAVFHSATMVVSGLFLLLLAAAGEMFRRVGPNWGSVAEIGLIFSGVLAIAVLITSRSARSRLRGLVVDHFFSHRYDYRREWMKCLDTLSPAEVYRPMHSRAIQAVAQIVDSPGGILMLREPGDSPFHWAGSWNMPAVPAPLLAEHPLVAGLAAGPRAIGGTDTAPPLDSIGRIWLAVPLPRAGHVLGIVILAPPRAAFALDREVFDLLRVIGRQVADTIAEHQAAQQLVQTRELHAYGQRFAFVAHDIKNVSSQLSLLLSNAELHIRNEDFQRDMLLTVRASVRKIGALLRRLQTPEGPAARALTVPAETVDAVVAACRPGRASRLVVTHDSRSARVAIDPAALEAVLTHIITNALDASPADRDVRVRLLHDTRRLVIEVIDQGCGMTPEFIRDSLFTPFRTSKTGGSGIGAYQARQLLREAGGDLLVESHPGAGTTARILLPLVETAIAAAPAPQAAADPGASSRALAG